MDKYFRLITDNTANSINSYTIEYLDDNGVMNLEIYLKKKAGYYLTYIPDAKAFTDAPESFLNLIK